MEKMKYNIAILMATYNGGEYLREQINSIINQTIDDWTLYIHDDGSSDNTNQILEYYCSKYDNIVTLKYPSQKGAKNNFFSLVRLVEADYYLFCDQDDVWKQNKIELEIEEMKSMEGKHGDVPLLVFSDLEVVDKNLNVISPSMWQNGGIRPELLTSFDSGAVFEYVTGCTMLFNRMARDSVIYPADKALMHDSWVFCCILKARGHVNGLRKPLVSYRQHGDNTLGATSWSSYGLLYKIVHISKIFRNNYRHWEMLKSLGYGSFIKYLKYKYLIRYVRLKNK